MSDTGEDRQASLVLTRRDFLQFGAGAAAAALLPAAAAAAPDRKPGAAPPHALDDPYKGAIPLVFPVAEGAYRKPVRDNWHANREGAAYPWSHENSATQRAHDGVDIFPRFAGSTVAVYAPFASHVAAVNVDGYAKRADPNIALPWDYPPNATSPGQNIYGNYLWLRSEEQESAGFFMFYCHLRDEGTLRALADRLGGGQVMVYPSTPVGVLGETGNAAGDPQLHLEIHYPYGKTFVCQRCAPAPRPGMTAINPHPSLSNAVKR